MRRMTKMAALLTVPVLALAACGGNGDGDGDDTAAGGTGEPTAESDVKVGLAYDIGGRGDQSFNDSAAAGLDKADEEFGIEAKESEAERRRGRVRPRGAPAHLRRRRLQPDHRGRLRLLRVGRQGRQGVPRRPLRDHRRRGSRGRQHRQPGLRRGAGLVPRRCRGGAEDRRPDHVGFIGGVEVPLIQKFEAGYDAGAKAVNPDIKVDVEYLTQPPDFSGFGDPAKGKTAAQGMFDAGADIVYHAAGGSGGGVFEAASEAEARRPSASTPTSTTPPTRRSRTSS